MRVEVSPDLKAAADHLKQAVEATAERIVGSPAAHHLRQAMKHVLVAGVKAIDEAEARSQRRTEPPAANG